MESGVVVDSVLEESGEVGGNAGAGYVRQDRNLLLDRLVQLRRIFVRRLMPSKVAALGGALRNVTLHQLEVLHLLESTPLAMSELARQMDVSESAATSLVDRLVRQGLVERFSDPSDRRVVRVRLAEEALAMASALSSQRRAAAASVFGVLDDTQLRTLVDLLELVATGIEVPGSEPAGTDLFR